MRGRDLLRNTAHSPMTEGNHRYGRIRSHPRLFRCNNLQPPKGARADDASPLLCRTVQGYLSPMAVHAALYSAVQISETL